jgi:transposase
VIPHGVRVFLCVEPVDMRLGFDRLAQLARERVGQDPVDGGAVFVFGGRAADRTTFAIPITARRDPLPMAPTSR